MRRLLVLLSGTITGLVGVLSYNPPHLAGAMTAPLATTPANQTQPEASSTAVESPRAMSPATETPSNTAASKNSNAKKLSTPKQAEKQAQTQPDVAPQEVVVATTFQGSAASTKYGPVQVQITVSNGHITNAEALVYPSRDRRSLQISQAVIPWLVQETLRIQSSGVMAVSGATITTNAWNSSLASALQKAGK